MENITCNVLRIKTDGKLEITILLLLRFGSLHLVAAGVLLRSFCSTVTSAHANLFVYRRFGASGRYTS